MSHLRHVLTVTASACAAGLALASCSTTEETTSPSTNDSSTETTTKAQPTDGPEVRPEKANLNEPVQLAQNPGNDVQLTIEKITLGQECAYGTNDYGEFSDDDQDFGKLKEGEQYLQVWASLDVKQVETQVGNDWIMLEDPEILDKEGYTQSTGMAVDCRDSDEGYELWSSTVDSGKKKRLYGSFVVPTDTKTVLIMDTEYPAEQH